MNPYNCSDKIEQIVKEKGVVSRRDIVKLLSREFPRSTIYYNLKSLCKMRVDAPILHLIKGKLVREVVGLNRLGKMEKDELPRMGEEDMIYILGRKELYNVLNEKTSSRFKLEIEPMEERENLHTTIYVGCKASAYSANSKLKIKILPAEGSQEELDLLWFEEKTLAVDFNPGESKRVPIIHVRPSKEAERTLWDYQKALENWKREKAHPDVISHVTEKVRTAETHLGLSISPCLSSLVDDKQTYLLSEVLYRERAAVIVLAIYSRDSYDRTVYVLGFDHILNKRGEPTFFSIRFYQVVE